MIYTSKLIECVAITDLNFKVVMTQSGNGSYAKSCCKRHDEQEGKLYFYRSIYKFISCILKIPEDSDELKSIMLEEEARQLRNSLINEKNRNARLMKVIEQRRQAV